MTACPPAATAPSGPALSGDTAHEPPVLAPPVLAPSVIAPAVITAEILRQTTARGADRSICPSEVARALDPDWRRLMAPVRRAAAQLAAAGRIDILRKGRPVAPEAMRGVIRLRLRAGPPAPGPCGRSAG